MDALLVVVFFFFHNFRVVVLLFLFFFFFKSLETTHVPCLVKCFVFLPLFRFARVRSCRYGVCVCMCFLVIVSRPIACFTTVKKKKKVLKGEKKRIEKPLVCCCSMKIT